jgi:transposase-like protein
MSTQAGRKPRRSYSPQFKAEAVAMVVELGKSAAEAARDLEVNESTLGRWVHRWRLEHGEGTALPLRPVDAARLAEQDAEIKRLTLENSFLNYGDVPIIHSIQTAGSCRPGRVSAGRGVGRSA